MVIGRLAKDVRAEEAFRVILGYTCGNDVTLRDLQKTDDQWARAKGFDGSAPLGPWIETDLDPNDVVVETRLNGEVRQHASSVDMVYGVATLIEYITSFMTLLPGDVLLTGTPEGVGKLAPGDVEVEVEGVGVLANGPMTGAAPRMGRFAAGSLPPRAGRSMSGTCAALFPGSSRVTIAARSSCGSRTPTRAE